MLTEILRQRGSAGWLGLADVLPQRLVEEGDSVDQVLAACGAPAERKIKPPALRNNDAPKFKAAETPFWPHGPENGASRHLKFIDGKLVEIRVER